MNKSLPKINLGLFYFAIMATHRSLEQKLRKHGNMDSWLLMFEEDTGRKIFFPAFSEAIKTSKFNLFTIIHEESLQFVTYLYFMLFLRAIYLNSRNVRS